MHACMHTCTHTYTHTHMYIHTHKCTYICLRVGIYTPSYKYIYAHKQRRLHYTHNRVYVLAWGTENYEKLFYLTLIILTEVSLKKNVTLSLV